jgi:mannose/cellobiose epimerase-like protein (N-acyl-D-glucosamine 2-epimerase family)/mannose-1-phosphate guanylyltransferase
MAAVPGARRPIIVTGVNHQRLARAQLDALGIEGLILAEPQGRDSAPALIAAALWVARTDPAGILVAVASDHHIPDDAAFAAAVEAALPAAIGGHIVTFGVRPAEPSVAYGYIRVGAPLAGEPAVRRVDRFVEKPAQAQAEGLVAQGCLWNSGNFVGRADVLIDEATAHAPAVVDGVRDALVDGVAEGDLFRLGDSLGQAPKVSIDVAVMEKTARAAVLPIDYAWSDLGAWNAVWAALPQDDAGNAVSGRAVVRACRDSLVRVSAGGQVVAIGLTNMAVIVQDHSVLVTSLDQAPNLKPAVAELDARDGATRPAGGLDAPSAAARASGSKAWLWENALPLWWCFGADHGAGGFHERLGQDLTPVPMNRRARVQARQVHVYASAGMMGWPGPWASAVDHGLACLFDRYRRADGLFRASVDPAGAPAEEQALLYDQAFVLLALATAARARPDQAREMTARGEVLLAAIRRTFAHEGGGFRAHDGEAEFLANPIMHLFEAALAWIDAGAGACWRDLAAEIAALCETRLYNPTRPAIGEVFDSRWRAAPGVAGRIVEPGHQFEWAWLLERWACLGGQRSVREAAHGLYAVGERGVDPLTGLVFDAVLDDFSPHRTSSRLWPQTERVKAALLLAPTAPAGGAKYRAAARSSMAAIGAYLDTPVAGLWRDTPDRHGAEADTPALASSFYHLWGAIAAWEAADGPEGDGGPPR